MRFTNKFDIQGAECETRVFCFDHVKWERLRNSRTTHKYLCSLYPTSTPITIHGIALQIQCLKKDYSAGTIQYCTMLCCRIGWSWKVKVKSPPKHRMQRVSINFPQGALSIFCLPSGRGRKGRHLLSFENVTIYVTTPMVARTITVCEKSEKSISNVLSLFFQVMEAFQHMH